MEKFTSTFLKKPIMMLLLLVGSSEMYGQSDVCSTATPLTVNSTCAPVAGTIVGASTEETSLGDPGCSYDYQGGDVWYSFVATDTIQSISLTFTSTESPVTDLDFGYVLYSGTCGTLTEEDCENGDYAPNFGDAYNPYYVYTNLNVGQTYLIRVFQDDSYDENGDQVSNPRTMNFTICVKSPSPQPANDSASAAIALTVGQPCTGNTYSNESATAGVGEPYSDCNDESEGEHSVWFKFVAPASGAVRITTDIGPTLGTLSDTKIGLFSATDSSDYSTFTILACDEDNGIIGDGYTSTIFSSSLTGGQTYYVEVDGYSASDYGTFCLQVEEINPTMLSNAASCTDLQSPLGATNFTGWVTLVDENGKLVANVKDPAGGSVGDYYGYYNVDGDGNGTPRQDPDGNYYLSRNYTISNFSTPTNVEVKFYFQPGEMAVLAGVTGNATNLGNLSAIRQEGEDCHADLSSANGTTTQLMQNSSGTVNGVGWIDVTTSSFSNFYLEGGTSPLVIHLKSISAKNMGASNQVSWTTASESKGDYFELERSADGRNFSLLSKISSKEMPSDYSYNDKTPFKGVNYYRLKLMDAGGRSNLSNVVQATVLVGGQANVNVYPNPATKNITVHANSSGNGTVTLTDISGRTIYQAPMEGSEMKIDVSSLVNGFYFIRYVDSNLNQVIKVNKQ